MNQLDWKVLNSEYLLQNEWIAVRADTCEMGNGRLVDPYYIVESRSYVNVVPVTPEGEVLLLRIYRHGLGRTLLETPGGLQIFTIHAFCQTVLKRFPIEAGLAPHFAVIDERDAAAAEVVNRPARKTFRSKRRFG